MYNMTYKPILITKSKAILLALISLTSLTMITAGTLHNVIADPTNCFGQECYILGYQNGQANHGISCPSGQSFNFCAGWYAGASM
jgi:hypothetical protein